VAQAAGIVRIVAEMRETVRGRVEPVEAVFRADPDHALAVFDERISEIIAEAGRVVRVVVPAALEPPARVEPHEAAPGQHPQGIVASGHQGLHVVDTAIARQRNRRKTSARGIAPRQAGRRADPQPAAQRQQRADHVVRQAAGAPRIVAEGFDSAGGPVQAQQPGAGGAQPQASVRRGRHREDLAAAGVKRLPPWRHRHETLEPATGKVGPVDAAEQRTDPQRSGAVDVDGGHLVVGQRLAVERLADVSGKTDGAGGPPLQAVEIGADPQLACRVAVQGQHARVAHALVGADVAPDRQALADAPCLEAGARADPQFVARPDRERPHRVAFVAKWGDVKMVDAAGAGRQAVEPGRAADPERAANVAHQCVDAVVVQTVGVGRVVVQRADPPAGGIQVHQTFAGPDPQAACPVVDERADGTVACGTSALANATVIVR
jgi:hypothetical protein